ncbi:MAG: alpha-1,2-fucosyltransferase [Verrucomicrobia bacterium]|nr:alpha-1,2-fucosyltransferase [Verrucomicrobiota bacterium]
MRLKGFRFLFFLLVSSGQGIAGDYVTCNYEGQLGNNLFQIAVTTAYAIDHGCEALFPPIRPDYLPVLHRIQMIPAPTNVAFEVFQEPGDAYYSFVPIPYYDGISLLLRGYFQTEKYFAHHKEAILELFAPTQEILDEIHEKYGELLSEETVGLHIRTYIPDYSNPDEEGFRGVPFDYFLRAMEQFDGDAHFLVFSDCIDWAKSKLASCQRKITFIEGNPHYLDLYLLSLCKHQIISPRSTFSWWAAWMNRNPEKRVIASVQPDASDHYPESWIILN